MEEGEEEVCFGKIRIELEKVFSHESNCYVGNGKRFGNSLL